MTVTVRNPSCHPDAQIRLDYFEVKSMGWTKVLCAKCSALLALVPTVPKRPE